MKDLQRDPVRRDILHVDFLRVDPNRTVAVEVPIVIVGEAKEVENNRGIAEQSMKSITVHTKPADIPSHFEVDITNLTVGTSITISELEVGLGWTNRCGNLRVSAGYYFAIWDNVVTMPEYINAVQTPSYIDVNQDDDDNISFDGLVIRTELLF